MQSPREGGRKSYPAGEVGIWQFKRNPATVAASETWAAVKEHTQNWYILFARTGHEKLFRIMVRLHFFFGNNLELINSTTGLKLNTMSQWPISVPTENMSCYYWVVSTPARFWEASNDEEIYHTDTKSLSSWYNWSTCDGLCTQTHG